MCRFSLLSSRASNKMASQEYMIFALVGHRKSAKKQFQTSITQLPSNTMIVPENQSQLKRETNLTTQIMKPFSNENHQKKMPFIVIAVDFGTTHSGYSFVFTRDKHKIHYMRTRQGLQSYKMPYVEHILHIKQAMMLMFLSTSTIVLLNPDQKFHSFGNEARNFFYSLEPKKASKWYYFEHFKMNLYKEKIINIKFRLKPLNQSCYIKALKVFVAALKYLFKQAICEIGEQLAIPLDKEDIVWVLTVPAIWSESCKQFMRVAAEKTGLVCSDLLRIAIEPEVASLHCRNYFQDQLRFERKFSQIIEANKCFQLHEGSKYVIVDAGGGTIDITAHEIMPNAYIKEIHKSIGGPSGALEINKQFELLLSTIVGDKAWHEFKFKFPTSCLELMETFELRKLEAKPERQTPYNISLPFSFIHFFTSTALEEAFRKTSKGICFSPKLGLIRLDAASMKQFFQKIIEKIIHSIKSLIKELLQNGHRINHIFLVGGFAESDIFKQEMKLAFEPDAMVVVPKKPHIAVLYGACQYGLDPTLIKSRRATKTYGVAVLTKYDPELHPAQKKITQDGHDWCSDVLDKFVTVNQPVALFESIKRQYRPVMKNQSSCIFHIYSSDQANVQFISDPGVTRCGTLYLELDPIPHIHFLNPAVQELQYRAIELEMHFGESEIKIRAIDLQTGFEVKSSIDFLNQNC